MFFICSIKRLFLYYGAYIGTKYVQLILLIIIIVLVVL